MRGLQGGRSQAAENREGHKDRPRALGKLASDLAQTPQAVLRHLAYNLVLIGDHVGTWEFWQTRFSERVYPEPKLHTECPEGMGPSCLQVPSGFLRRDQVTEVVDAVYILTEMRRNMIQASFCVHHFYSPDSKDSSRSIADIARAREGAMPLTERSAGAAAVWF